MGVGKGEAECEDRIESITKADRLSDGHFRAFKLLCEQTSSRGGECETRVASVI